jgi:MFS family permease
MAGVLLLLALFVVAYLVDRFGPLRRRLSNPKTLRPMEIPAAIATKRGSLLALLVLVGVVVLCALYPKHYWLIVFWGILGYVGFLLPLAHRVNRHNG